MKVAILLGYAVAGVLVLLGDREMSRDDEFADVRMGGSILVIAGCVVAILATIAMIFYVVWSI